MRNILSLDPSTNLQTRITVGLFINLIAIPFLYAVLFLLFKLVRDLLGEKISNTFKWIYLACSCGLTLLFGIYILNFSKTSNNEIPDLNKYSPFVIANTLFIFLLYLAIVQIFFYLNRIRDQKHRQALRTFALIYLSVISLFFVFVYVIPAGRYFYILSYFSLNLIPLLYCIKYLAKFYLKNPLFYEEEQDIERVFDKLDVTNREKEIIRLICEGKSNKDIEEILFISIQTVKNNIYNIYRKLKVKNRVELINLFSHLLKKE